MKRIIEVCLRRGLTSCFQAILGALGRIFSSCLSKGLDCNEIVEAAKTGGLKEGGIVIGYEDLLAGEHRI